MSPMQPSCNCRFLPQVKKRDDKQRTARGAGGRQQRVAELQSNEEKLAVVREAIKRAKDIAEAEEAQLSVWQKMHEREALRQDILKKAREKKKKMEEDLRVAAAASLAKQEDDERRAAAELEKRRQQQEELGRQAEAALIAQEEWQVERQVQDEEDRKAAAKERLQRVEEKLRRAEERMAAKARPRPRRGFKGRPLSASSSTQPPLPPPADGRGSDGAAEETVLPADPDLAMTDAADLHGEEKRDEDDQPGAGAGFDHVGAEEEAGQNVSTADAEIAVAAASSEVEAEKVKPASAAASTSKYIDAAARAALMRRYGEQTLRSERLKGQVTTNPRLGRALKRLDKLKRLNLPADDESAETVEEMEGGKATAEPGPSTAMSEAEAEPSAPDSDAGAAEPEHVRQSGRDASAEEEVEPAGPVAVDAGAGPPLEEASLPEAAAAQEEEEKEEEEGTELQNARPGEPPPPPPPLPPTEVRLAPDGTPLPPEAPPLPLGGPIAGRPAVRKGLRRRGRKATSRPMSSVSKAAPEDLLLEEKAATALITQARPPELFLASCPACPASSLFTARFPRRSRLIRCSSDLHALARLFHFRSPPEPH